MAQKNDSRGAKASIVEAGAEAGADVLDAVGERVAELEVGGRPGLLHVVAGDRDRVELRHLPRREAEDVGDDPHRRRRRVDVRVPDHELLEHVVLDRAGELLRLDALLLGGDDVEREHRQHGAVHRHRHAHLVERDAVEQLAHVEDRVDGHAGHADVALHPRVVAVVAAVGGEVEGDRQALLAGGQVAAVERVGLLGGREPGVLADRPRLVHVHRRVRAAQERGDAGIRGEEVEVRGVGGREEGADLDALRRVPASRRRPRRPRRPTPPWSTPWRRHARGWSRSPGWSWHLQAGRGARSGWPARRRRRGWFVRRRRPPVRPARPSAGRRRTPRWRRPRRSASVTATPRSA